MKGIAHFLTGVALATFFPEVVAMAREGALLPALAGIGALLPDTLDFRFVQFWQRFDVEIDPAAYGAAGADAGQAAETVADRLAAAIHAAYTSRTPRRVIVHTLRLGSDLWRRYTLRFDPEAGTIAVRMGPLVNTGQVAYPGTAPPDAAWATRDLGIPLSHSYSREYDVDIFSGPTFLFVPEGDGLRVDFLDWHHRWTHSLLLALGVGACVGALAGLVWGEIVGLWAAVVTWLGFSAHVLEDQLGHMGSSLLWPVRRARIRGLGALHASDAAPNFLVVWTALAVILFNLDRFSGPGRLPQLPYTLGVIGVPWALHVVLGLLRRLRAHMASSVTEAGDSDGAGAPSSQVELEQQAEAAGPDFA